MKGGDNILYYQKAKIDYQHNQSLEVAELIEEVSSVFLFMQDFPDTLIANNKDYYQSLYCLDLLNTLSPSDKELLGMQSELYWQVYTHRKVKP